MTTTNKDTEYRIDHEGIDGKWRVWWLGTNGLICERLFNTKELAEKWVEVMESLES